MAKYSELLDAGMRIAARFHSHCPQTARLYYHPPTKHNDNHHQQHQEAWDRVFGYGINRVEPNLTESFGSKSKEGFGVDIADLILHTVS